MATQIFYHIVVFLISERAKKFNFRKDYKMSAISFFPLRPTLGGSKDRSRGEEMPDTAPMNLSGS